MASQGNQSKDRIKPERHGEDKKCRNDTSQPQRRGQDCHGESGQKLDLENDHASVQTNMIGNTLASASFALSDSSALSPTSFLYPSGCLAIMCCMDLHTSAVTRDVCPHTTTSH